jgi:CHAD domain-containing protein
MSESTAPAGPFTPSQKQILKIARKRLEKFASIAPRLLVSDHPDTIHDIRVWSRRLQQITNLLFPKPRRSGSRTTIRALRNLRRQWGACRNLDVTLDLLKELASAAADDPSRQAWNAVREGTSKLRAKEFVRARQRLRRFDLIDFIDKTRKLFDKVKPQRASSSFGQSIEESMAEWRDALDQAKNALEPQQLHALRLAGKQLRYRLELLADLGENGASSRVDSLKALQDQLGAWNDRHVLLQLVEEFIARRQFERDRPGLYQTLKSAMENERRQNDAAIPGILKQAEVLAANNNKRPPKKLRT